MPINAPFIFSTLGIIALIRLSILVILALYIVYSLIVIRQVDLMTKTLITPVSPIVKALAIFNAGFAIAFFVLAIGSL